jgi:hypothetical protein
MDYLTERLTDLVIEKKSSIFAPSKVTKGFGKRNMRTIIAKVVAQTEAVYVPSKKAENGQVAKSVIRLKELGGEYEDEFACTLFGNLALCKFVAGDLVAAALRFQAHESNGQFYQDVVATDVHVI